MALLEIPTRVDLPAYSQIVTLEGTAYQLDFTFNQRMALGVGKWMLQISDSQGNPIIDEVPVVATWPLFKRFRDARLPKGTIYAFDTSGQNLDPGRFDFGDRVRLLYLESGS